MANVKLTILSKFKDDGVKAAKGAFDKLKPSLAAVGVGLAGAGVAAAAGLGAATVEIVKFGNETQTAMDQFATRTGTSREALEQYKETALAVFAGPPPLGETVSDVAVAMADVENASGLAGQALEDATRGALTVSEKFDQDFNEVLRTADSLVKNGIAKSFPEAFDIITRGFQEGGNKADDLLGTLDEYAQDLAILGFDGGESLALINQGLEAGIFNTDKIGDAVNEAFINLRDPAAVTALGEIDSGLADIATRFNSGEIDGQTAFNQIIAGIESIEDPMARTEAGVLVFRSMWEDLGEEAITSLGGVTEGVENIAGATERAGQNTTDLGALWESTMRNLQVATEPIAAELMPFLVEAIGAVSEFLTEAQPTFEAFAQTLGANIGPAATLIADAFQRTAVALGLTSENSTATDAALVVLEGSLNLIVTALQAVALGAQGFAFLVEQASEAVQVAGDLASLLSEIVSLAGQVSLGDLAGAVGGGIGDALGFAEGGIVPGPAGAPQAAIVHGGEMVLNQEQQQAIFGQTGTGSGTGDSINAKLTANFDGQGMADAITAKIQAQLNQTIMQFQNDMIAELTR